DLIFVLTAGGPADATRVLALDMYLRGFRGHMMGPASVVAVILVLLGLVLALVLQRLGGREPNARQLEGAWSWRSRTRRPPPARSPDLAAPTPGAGRTSPPGC